MKFTCEKCGTTHNVRLVSCEGMYCEDCEMGMLESVSQEQFTPAGHQYFRGDRHQCNEPDCPARIPVTDEERIAAVHRTAEETAEPVGEDLPTLVGEAVDKYWNERENCEECKIAMFGQCDRHRWKDGE